MLALLVQGVVLTRASLRDSLAVRTSALAMRLESLERAGRLCRTPAGWQRRDRSPPCRCPPHSAALWMDDGLGGG